MKTIVYIDGQNFLYKVSEILIEAGVVVNKQEVCSVDIPKLLSCILDREFEIRFYGVKKIRRCLDYGDEIRQKSVTFADNLRRTRNFLAKTGVKYIEAGKLRVRDSDVCKKCKSQDYRFQEKGVDVGLAVDMVRDALTDNVDQIVLVSSDTDLIPAVLAAKDAGKHITYIGFDNKLTGALVAKADKTQVLRDKEIIENYIQN